MTMPDLDRRDQPTMRAIVTPLGSFMFGPHRLPAAIGRGGIRPDKREGDGATPTGPLPLRRVLYRPDRQPAPKAMVPVSPLVVSDGWCDDPAHVDYNRSVRLPIDCSAEALWRDDAIYDIIGVLGWNDDPVQPARGSAIFLHVARDDFSATEGCVALALPDLVMVLASGLTEILVTA
jgi:L,D-peptidoglycan transpeptidase YkuD (ErfK/YbiS/YcfS/YnhG family)